MEHTKLNKYDDKYYAFPNPACMLGALSAAGKK
jgi:hypothetical protein